MISGFKKKWICKRYKLEEPDFIKALKPIISTHEKTIAIGEVFSIGRLKIKRISGSTIKITFISDSCYKSVIDLYPDCTPIIMYRDDY